MITAMGAVRVRMAEPADAVAIAVIYNQEIEGREATFETEPRSRRDFAERVAVAVLCAGLSARRGGRLPPDVLFATAADPTGGGVLFAWLALWPIIATLAIGAPALTLGHAITHHLPLLAPIAVQFAATVAIAAILGRQAWRTHAPD